MSRPATAYWNDYAGRGWAEHAAAIDLFSEPLGRSATEAAAVRPGERVLDVGCGCGGSTLELARAASPGGYAVGVDVSGPMIEEAERRARERLADGDRFLCADVEFLCADVEDLPARCDPFDVAWSRMAIMLFDDPVAGCSAVRRALRPGGRLAATTFRGMADTPWLPAVMLGAAPHVGPLRPLPMADEPGPFAFADAERARAVLEAAGFEDVEVAAVDVVLCPPADRDEATELLICLGPAGGAYLDADPEQRRLARDGAAALLDRSAGSGGRWALPSGIWLLTARVPK